MAEQSGFFNSNVVNGEYDRVYLAESFAKYFASFVGNGVFGGKLSELMVVQSVTASMKIEVLPGMGWINGYWYENSSNLSFNIAVADGVLNRIDSVVLQWNRQLRSMNVVVKKGTPATEPVAPAIQRDIDIYELKIAEVNIKAGATSILQTDIRDTRANTDVCGFVTGLIKQIDTVDFSNQLNYFLKELELKNRNEINSIVDRLNALIEDESVLGGLSTNIDNVKNELALVSQTLGYVKKNILPYPYAQTSRTTNGITWTNVGDGTVKANGTATTNSYFILYRSESFSKGKYIVSSGADVAGKHFIFIRFVEKGSSTEVGTTIFGYNNVPFEITKEDAEKYDVSISLSIASNTTVTNLLFKPMLRRAEILNGDWEPYKLSFGEMIQEDEVEKGCFYRMNRFTGIKEWINPPLKYGVEYCTTERWQNKPVYQNTFYLSTLPNKTIAAIETGINWDEVISINAYALDSDDLTYYPFPVFLQNQVAPVAVINKVESDGSLVVTSSIDATYLKAYVTVKYTKQ